MLIVVSIILILLGLTLRVVQPVGDRRIREAARAVNVYLSSARNRAIELGRPCGVIFRRASNTNTPTASMVLEQYVVPPPYAGATTDAVVEVQDQSVAGSGQITLRIRIRGDDFYNNLIYPGDQIQLNNQGPYYFLSSGFPLDGNDYFDFSVGVDSDGDGFYDNYYLTAVLSLQSTPMQAAPWTSQWSQPVSFQILRSFQKTSASILQLPTGTVVDLDFSGPGDGIFPTKWTPSVPSLVNYDVGIVFSSNGALEGMHCYRYNSDKNIYEYGGWRTAWPVYLLVGSSSRVRDFGSDPLPANPNSNEKPNWADLSSVWLTISYETGMVSTSENSPYMGTPDWTDATSWMPFVIQSRAIARESQSMGGR